MNAAFFFKAYSSEMAQWIVDFWDDVEAKGPQTAVERRRIACDLLDTRVLAGEEYAFHYMHLNMRPAFDRDYKTYEDFDSARATQIVTGNGGGGAQDDRGTGKDREAAGSESVHEGAAGGDLSGRQGPRTADSTDKQGGCSGGWSTELVTKQGGSTGQTVGTGTQGTLFVIKISHFRAGQESRRKRARAEYQRLNGQRLNVTRLTKQQKDVCDDIELVDKALPLIEDLAQKYRAEENLAGLLRAADLTPEDLQLTNRAAEWFDAELKAM